MACRWLLLAICVSSSVGQTIYWPSCGGTEQDALHWTDEYNEKTQEVWPVASEASWKYNTDITSQNQADMVAASIVRADYDEQSADCARQWDYSSFSNQLLARQMGKIAEKGSTVLNDEDYNDLQNVMANMETTYSTACVNGSDRPNNNDPQQCLPLDPDLSSIMANSRDWDELLWAWDGWRKVSGNTMPAQYNQMVELLNKAARMNGYDDNGEYWRNSYEESEFRQICEKLWLQLKPLYQKLHAYVRHKLQEQYPSNQFPAGGFIPAHILGNMWAQSWTSVEDIMRPYPGEEGVDATPEMVNQGIDALDMFVMAEDFFTSLGLESMPGRFWSKSMIEKPTDRDAVCHASAWDFYNQKDFRIKQCTEPTMGWLTTTHHEMGHVQYYLQYINQPVKFRRGGNPGFHEAIGDVMSLSVATPTHLKEIGLLPNFVDQATCKAPRRGGGGLCEHKCSADTDCEKGLRCCKNGCGSICAVEEPSKMDMNFLMSQALRKIAFVPFGYMIDQFRWDIFDGSTHYSQFNEKWWDVRCKYQGIAPSIPRRDDGFDAGAKYHVPANTPYIRYFMSIVHQFQFHKSLCDAAGWKGHLSKCDIYNSKEAGKRIGDMMKLGSSVHWSEALYAISGTREISAEPIIEYFQPLMEWLDEQITDLSLTPGWDEDNCPQGILEATPSGTAWNFLRKHNDEGMVESFKSTTASWNYNTNLTQHNQQIYLQVSSDRAAWSEAITLEARTFDAESYSDPEIVRQLNKLSQMGTAVLDDTDYNEMGQLTADMKQTYSTAKVCDRPNYDPSLCYPLDPDLTEIMATSRDWDELVWAWKGWRDESGAKMSDDYEQFVSLQNKAADMNGYEDAGDYWRSGYEDPAFRTLCEDLWEQVKPLYEELHAYVRHFLRQTYSANGGEFPTEGHIPAHLLGNMWAQTWQNIEPLVRPDPEVPGVDITDELKRQNKTILDLFHISEEFFTSLGLEAMPQPFWDHSMIEKPTDRDAVCHASAWDFSNRVDFRIKQCTEVNTHWLYVTHHEMGHVQYFLQYKDQPLLYRGGANGGFHEAIGDVMELSVSTPSHLNTLGFFPEFNHNAGLDLNFLMDAALKKVAFLPFGYLIDQWRWDVFDGSTNKSDYNKDWWAQRCKYQGVSPPVDRDNTHFDPGAKYHIPANSAYIQYFVSYILQFHFHKSLCEAKGWIGPLHRCDIYNSQEAGLQISEMMRLGSSKPWPDALEAMTGSRVMSAEPLIEYFQPLRNWFADEFNRLNITSTGWTEACPSSVNIS